MNSIQQKRLNNLLEGVGDMALKRRARKIIEELDPKKGDKILDLGCGDGFYLFLLSNLGLSLRLTGSDFDQAGLEAAKRNLKNGKINLTQGDLMKHLPFANNEFDKIVLSEVAEHLPNDLKGFREVYSILKPDGILCLSVPNANYPFFWDPVNWILEHLLKTHIKSGFWAGIWFNHLRLYKPEQIKQVVQQAGFKVENVESLTWWCLPFNHYLVNLVARLLWGGKLSPQVASSVNKYAKSGNSKPWLIKSAFGIVNWIDSLNNFYQPVGRGVGVFLKAVKPTRGK